MELRKKVNPPKRLDDEIAEEAENAERMFPARPTSGQVYRGEIMHHNPNLPPAAFPTLDLRRNTLDHVQRHPKKRIVPSSLNTPSPSPVSSNQYPINETVTAPETVVTRASHEMDPRQSRTVSQEGRLAPHTDNGPGNPIWESNMKRIQTLGNRSRQEEIMAEMDTSDEEDAPAQTHVKPTKCAQCPNWDDIALRLQIHMVTSAVDDDGDAVVAYRRLRLTQAQQDTITVKLYEQRDRDAAEDAAIAAHQRKCHEELMKGRKLGQEAFRSILSEHLFKDLQGDYMTVSLADVRMAQAYLLYCGLDPSVLNEWVDADEDDGVPLVVDEDEMMKKYPGGVTVEEAEQMYDRLPWDSPPPAESVTTEKEIRPLGEMDEAEFIPQGQSSQSRRRPSISPIIVPNLSHPWPVQSPFALKPAVLSPSTLTVARQNTNETIEVDTNSTHGPVASNEQAPPALEQPNTKEKSPQTPDEPRTPSPQRARLFTPRTKPVSVYVAEGSSIPPIAPNGSSSLQSSMVPKVEFSGSESEKPKPKRRRTHQPLKMEDTAGPAPMSSLARMDAMLEADYLGEPASSAFGAEDSGSSMPPTPSPIIYGDYYQSLSSLTMRQSATVARMGNSLAQTPCTPVPASSPTAVLGREDGASSDKQRIWPSTNTLNPKVLLGGQDARRIESHEPWSAAEPSSYTEFVIGESMEAASTMMEGKPKKKAGRRRKAASEGK
ncbi:MAG: hypothetical protein LQ352_007148 [Teloschistes flavicans]|nr:MAG: hypothetical protein LQ352_007148 [Teloschistes flavicans]